MEQCNVNLCCNIRYLRKRHGLTQKQMAKILGIGVEKLRRIEAEDPSARLNTKLLCALCDHFGFSADIALKERLEELEDTGG